MNRSFLVVLLMLVLIGCGGGTGTGTGNSGTADESTNPTTRTEAPTFSPPEGTYYTAQTVTISTTTPGATIKFTRGPDDDTAPPTSSNFNGTEYAAPLDIDKTTTVKTVCFKDGMTESVSTAKYVITVCDCQSQIFCYDFERGDLYGNCSNTDYWQTDDANNTYYIEREALAGGGRNGAYGLKLTGASSNAYQGRQGAFHRLNDLAPSQISFYIGTMSNSGNTGYFSLSQSIGGNGKYGIVFHFGNDGKMYVNDVDYNTFSISTWYLIEFKDIQWRSGTTGAGAAQKSTFDFYVNGAKVANDVNFKDSGPTGFDFLMLYNTDSTEVWYDDIIMLE